MCFPFLFFFWLLYEACIIIRLIISSLKPRSIFEGDRIQIIIFYPNNETNIQRRQFLFRKCFSPKRLKYFTLHFLLLLFCFLFFFHLHFLYHSLTQLFNFIQFLLFIIIYLEIWLFSLYLFSLLFFSFLHFFFTDSFIFLLISSFGLCLWNFLFFYFFYSVLFIFDQRFSFIHSFYHFFLKSTGNFLLLFLSFIRFFSLFICSPYFYFYSFILFSFHFFYSVLPYLRSSSFCSPPFLYRFFFLLAFYRNSLSLFHSFIHSFWLSIHISVQIKRKRI